ncbi:MAG: CBS domain-containing protein [Myxococcota bacterium]
MTRSTPISELMTSPVRTVGVDSKLSEVRRALTHGNFHHIPVVDGDTLVGIVSSRDLLRVYREFSSKTFGRADDLLDRSATVAEIMSTDLVMIRSHESIEAVIDLIASGTIHSVLVLDGEERLVGIVTDTDLLDYLCS